MVGGLGFRVQETLCLLPCLTMAMVLARLKASGLGLRVS